MSFKGCGEGLTDGLRSISQLIRLTRTNLFFYFVPLVFLFIASLLEGLSIGLLIPLLDILVNKGDTSVITKIPFLHSLLGLLTVDRFRYVFFILLGGILAAIFLKSGLIFASDLIASRIGRNSEDLMRTQIFDRYLLFSKRFFDKNKIGSLYDLAISEVSLASEFFHYSHRFVLSFCMILVYSFLMFFISWRLSLISLLMLPCIYLVVGAISKKILISTKQRFEIDQKMGAYLYDALSNLSLIRSYSNEALESKTYREISRTSRDVLLSIWKKILFAPHAQEAILSFFMAALVASSAFVFLKSQMISMAAFLSFFIVLRRFSTNLNQLGNIFTMITQTLTPIKRILWVFEDKDKEFIRSGSVCFQGLRKTIEFKNVFFSYDKQPILNGIDLSFEKGKMSALVGPSGGGKTSIINLVPRFYDTYEGSIRLDGVELREFDVISLRRKIAIVDQNVSLLNTTLRNNILYGLERPLKDGELEEVARKACLEGFIRTLPESFETFVGDRGVRLSGGEKQRVAIARAILKNPEIFIFDEATSFLDMETEFFVQEAIQNLVQGRTVIVIAHRLSTIKKADQIFMIEKGVVTERGNFKDLIAAGGRFQRYWELQVS